MADFTTELIQAFSDTSGVSADVSVQPSDNCHTMIFLNTDATNAVRIGIVANATALTAANSALLTAGSTLTLRIGTFEYRPFGSFGATTRVLRLLAVAGTPVVNIQFINATQGVAP